MDKSEAIKQFLVDSSGITDIGMETPLYSSGIIDSQSLLDLIVYLEEEFELKIKPIEISLDHFDSISKIINYLKK